MRIEQWSESIYKSLEILEQREHCKTLYNKIVAETSKITQNYRIQEMDSIKTDFWASFLLKHKEFQSSLQSVSFSLETCALGPICELISNSSDFLENYYLQFVSASEESKSFIRKLEKNCKYPLRLGYNHRILKVFNGDKENLEFVRGRIVEVNAVVIKKYRGMGEGELSIEIGDGVEVRDGEYHENWCKAIKENGELGFLPSNCVKIHKYATILTDLSTNYQIPEQSLEELTVVFKSADGKIRDSLKKNKENFQSPQKNLQFTCTIFDILNINTLFTQELLLNSPQALIEYMPYLSIYLDLYKLASSLLVDSSTNPLFLTEILQEIVKSIQKSLLFSFQKFLYCNWKTSNSQTTFEIFEIISSLLWRLEKRFVQVPTHREINIYLQDAKSSLIKRICLQQNALVLIPNYLILASMPFKIKSITALSMIKDISIDKETMIINTSEASFSFSFDSNKRAIDWMGEIERLIISTPSVCPQCNEANIFKRIVNCSKCNKPICVLCECAHN